VAAPDLRLPEGVLITALPLLPYEPGIEVYPSKFTGQMDYSFSAPGSWRGQVSIALFDGTGVAEASAINAVIAAMRGGAKTLALPLDGLPTIDDPEVATTVASIDAATGVLTFNRDAAIPDGAFFALEERLFQGVGSQPADDEVVPTPVFAAVVGQRLRPATEIVVRIVGDDLGIPRTADFWGPWTFSWIEVV